MAYRKSLHNFCTDGKAPMTFLTDKEELKPGLVIFRRGDVQHRNWYCRVKLPKTDRYKTHLAQDRGCRAAARDRAYDHDADLRFRIKHDVPIFNRSFSQIAKEYVEQQKRRAATGQVSDARWRKCESVIKARLDLYVGSTQIHLIGQDRWDDYPTWRRETSKGRLREQVSDATIRFEMSIFRAVMGHAVKKRYIRADQTVSRQADAREDAPRRVQSGGIPQTSHRRAVVGEGRGPPVKQLVSHRRL